MGLFDVVKPQVCEIGKIKIGGKGDERKSQSGGTYRMPAKYDHFVITSLNRNQAGDFIRDDELMKSLVADGWGDPDGKLRRIPISLLSNDIEDVMQAAWVWYEGKKVAARSDGVTLTKFFNGKEWLKVPEEVEWKPEYAELRDSKGSPRFKLHTIFNCVISVRQAHWGGVYKFRSTSRITASQLAGSLLEIKQLTCGVLRGMPLRLVMRPMQVAPEGKPTTVYVLHTELIGDDLIAIQDMALNRAKVELANAKSMNLAQLEYRKLVRSPGVEDEQEAAEIADEFHPESQPYVAGETVTADGEVVATSTPKAADPLLVGLGVVSETKVAATPAVEPAKVVASQQPDKPVVVDGEPEPETVQGEIPDSLFGSDGDPREAIK